MHEKNIARGRSMGRGRRRIAAEDRLVADVEVIDIAEDGKGVGRVGDTVVFIDKAIPGDLVDLELIRKKKNFYEAKVSRLVAPSPHRVTPFCEHFGVCGGCKWQHMRYSAQLNYKQKSVYEALTRIGKVNAEHIEPILPSAETRYYRNKLEFTFSNKRWLTRLDDRDDREDPDRRILPDAAENRWAQPDLNALGFHVPGRFDKILQIEHCHLQGIPSNDIRNALDAYAKREQIPYYDIREHTGALRNLIVRTASTGEVMVLVVFAYVESETIEQIMTFLETTFPSVDSFLYVINQKKNDTIFDQEVHFWAGKDHIVEEMEGLRFRVGPKSFYQTNSAQAYELYKIAREFANLKGNELVYDLYTGTGTIALFVAPHAAQVVGIEYVSEAIDDAKINARWNGIDNAHFYAGDMKDVLTPSFVEMHGRPDVVITDPPRAGMHPDVVARLLDMEAPRIVYVSCNAATQARDLAQLSEKYVVDRIQPVDMFPHTQHVENVVSLLLK